MVSITTPFSPFSPFLKNHKKGTVFFTRFSFFTHPPYRGVKKANGKRVRVLLKKGENSTAARVPRFSSFPPSSGKPCKTRNAGMEAA